MVVTGGGSRVAVPYEPQLPCLLTHRSLLLNQTKVVYDRNHDASKVAVISGKAAEGGAFASCPGSPPQTCTRGTQGICQYAFPGCT